MTNPLDNEKSLNVEECVILKMECPRIFGSPLSIVMLVFLTEMIRATTLSSLLGYMPTLLQRFGVEELYVGYYQGIMLA